MRECYTTHTHNALVARLLQLQLRSWAYDWTPLRVCACALTCHNMARALDGLGHDSTSLCLAQAQETRAELTAALDMSPAG